jgi:hypothetical protein
VCVYSYSTNTHTLYSVRYTLNIVTLYIYLQGRNSCAAALAWCIILRCNFLCWWYALFIFIIGGGSLSFSNKSRLLLFSFCFVLFKMKSRSSRRTSVIDQLHTFFLFLSIFFCVVLLLWWTSIKLNKCQGKSTKWMYIYIHHHIAQQDVV